jgi:hypothetical protein
VEIGNNCITRGDVLHMRGISCEMKKVLATEEVENRFLEIERKARLARHEHPDSPVHAAVAVRRTTKIKAVARLLAILDNPDNPVITPEHLVWAEDRQNELDSNLYTQVESGYLASAMSYLCDKAVLFLKKSFNGMFKERPSQQMRKDKTIPGLQFVRMMRNHYKVLFDKLKDTNEFRYKSPRQINVAFMDELEDRNILQCLHNRTLTGHAYSRKHYIKDYRILIDLTLTQEDLKKEAEQEREAPFTGEGIHTTYGAVSENEENDDD